MSSDVNFVRQQGFDDAAPAACSVAFPALMWQPRVIGLLVAFGLLLQAWQLFLVLGAILWWNVAVPSLNPFDALYNVLVASRRGFPRLGAAPAPRRFSQGMAGTFMLAIAVAIRFEWHTTALVIEAMLVIALSALVLGRFCLGSYIFYVLTGRAAFANRTVPWAAATK